MHLLIPTGRLGIIVWVTVHFKLLTPSRRKRSRLVRGNWRTRIDAVQDGKGSRWLPPICDSVATDIPEIIAALDGEIARLQQARTLIDESNSSTSASTPVVTH